MLLSQLREGPLRLFCLPWAGAAAGVYWKWKTLFGQPWDVKPLELPGRGARRAEPLFERFDDAVRGILDQIQYELRVPYVLFGHSLGALIAFELARILEAGPDRAPAALVVSGCAAPHVRRTPKPRSRLPRNEFVDALRALTGTSSEVLESNELMDLLLPAMRADFHIAEQYAYARSEPLDCPILALTGSEDTEVKIEEAAEWRALTRSAFALDVLSGGHFFVETSRDEVVARVSRWLDSLGSFPTIRDTGIRVRHTSTAP